MASTKKIDHLSDEQLMARMIENGDHSCLTVLYNRYAQRLLGFFLKMFKGDVPKSQDFLQELFIKVFEKRQQFDTSKKFYTWVFTIASNMCKTEFRKTPTENIDDHPEVNQKATYDIDETDRKYLKKRLKNEIQSLTDEHRSAFILRYIEGFSIQEIADITEANVGTVKSRLFYATKKLAHQLKDYQKNNTNYYG